MTELRRRLFVHFLSIILKRHCVLRSLQQIKIAVGAEVVTAAVPTTQQQQKRQQPLLSSRGRVLRRLRREGGDFDDFGSGSGDDG